MASLRVNTNKMKEKRATCDPDVRKGGLDWTDRVDLFCVYPSSFPVQFMDTMALGIRIVSCSLSVPVSFLSLLSSLFSCPSSIKI